MTYDRQHQSAGRMLLGTLRHALAAVALIGFGAIVGTALFNSPAAWGEVRETAPREAFQSGGQLSLPILKDISSTLHQMDARLARLEVVAQQMQTRNSRSAP